jgi:hypothetical protein
MWLILVFAASPAVVGHLANRHFHSAAFGRELESIRDQITNHLGNRQTDGYAMIREKKGGEKRREGASTRSQLT